MILLLVGQLWLNRLMPKELPTTFLKGSWQSCQLEDFSYAERVFTYRLRDKAIWEFHLGPADEFALFAGEGPDDADDDHSNPANLLGVAFHYHALSTKAGGRTWSAPSVRLLVNVVAAGGSRDDCMAFEVLVERLKP